MAYAVKYLFRFESVNGTTREIRILKDGYSGDPIQRALGRAPILKKQQNGPVCGTSLEIYAECHVDQEFIEFYTSDPKAYRVDVYDGNTMLWQGWITPELYSEPDIAPPYDVQVVATDGVGELKLYDFAPQGMKSLRAMFTYLLGKTGLGTDIYLISSLQAANTGAGAFLDMTLNLDYMEGKTCYEVLTHLLDTMHASITWWGGHWIVTRENNVTFSSGKVRYYNPSGNQALLDDSVQQLGAVYQDPAWPVGHLNTVIDPAKNKVAVQAPWHTVRGLQNPDMTTDTQWVKNSGAVYDDSYHGYSLPWLGVRAGGYAAIKQSVQMAGIRVPMTFTMKGTGCGRIQIGDPRTPVWTNGSAFAMITYQVGSKHYVVRNGSDGYFWDEHDPSKFFFDLFHTDGGNTDGIPGQHFYSVLADRIDAEQLTVDAIPAFEQDGLFSAGTLTVFLAGVNCILYGAELNIVVPKGYKDILRLDNGARGEGDEAEVSFGRVTPDVAYYQEFLQGILFNAGDLITEFSDDNFTAGMDFLSFISRDYARSVALPRARVEGTASLEQAVKIPPLVFLKDSMYFWIETWSWDMYEDELRFAAKTLPSATLTVESEVLTEAAGEMATSGSGSGGGIGSSAPSMAGYYTKEEVDAAIAAALEKYVTLDTTQAIAGWKQFLHVNGIKIGKARIWWDEAKGALYIDQMLVTYDDQVIDGGSSPTGGSFDGSFDNSFN